MILPDKTTYKMIEKVTHQEHTIKVFGFEVVLACQQAFENLDKLLGSFC